MIVAGETVGVLEIWEDKAPNVSAKIKALLPFVTTLQHGKLTGDLLLMQTPIVEAWENVFYPDEEFIEKRKAVNEGDVGMPVSFYPPRQQISILYGPFPMEPLPVSAIGQVIDGHDRIKAIAAACWFDPGELVELVLEGD